MRNSRSTILCLFCALALMAENAYGYLDPGTGSVLLQALVTALLGSALAIKVFWQKIKDFFVRMFSKTGGADDSGG